ncbi:MAG: nickel pincer cofactor biosynthesis protein LarB, partial [Desulfovibrionales bacterium]
MDRSEFLALLNDVSEGSLSPEEALLRLQTEPYTRLGHGLCLDNHRLLRTGTGEVVFGPNKSDEQLKIAVESLSAEERPVLVTKLNPAQGAVLQHRFPEGRFWEQPGLFACNRDLALTPPWSEQGELLIVSAGGSDLPLALEALGTARFYGLDAGLVTDVGVAGLHRLLPHMEALYQAKLLVVVAGMEGALPSVLSGMTGKPIIAVPSSVGYGASFSGLAPLLTMLNACSPGIAVVNIDNGFGAAVMAS